MGRTNLDTIKVDLAVIKTVVNGRTVRKEEAATPMTRAFAMIEKDEKSGKITVRLLKNSPVNALLSLMYNVQSTSSVLWGKNIISLASGIGDSITAQQVAFTRQPTVVYSEDGPINEWDFDAITVDMLLAASI